MNASRPNLDRIWCSFFALAVSTAVSAGQEPRVFVTPGARGPTVRLESGGEAWSAGLRPKSSRATGFRVLVDEGDVQLREWPAPPISTYFGDAPGGGRCIASVTNGLVRASFWLPDGRTWQIEPRADGTYSARRTDGADALEGTCGTLDRPAKHTAPDDAFAARSINVRICEIACDADYEFYQLNGGSIDATVADIEAVMAGVTDLYDIDVQLAMQISTVIVRTVEPDPYTATNAYTLLDEFYDWWRFNHTDIHRDIAHLFTGKDLDGTVIGIGEVESVCYLSAYSIAQSRYRPEWDRRWAISAHELAHNLGCHTHCDDEWTCRIMCTSLGGCNGFHSFGEWAVGRMKSYMSTVSCLSPGTSNPDTAALPFVEPFVYPNINTGRWTANDGAFIEFGAMNEPSPPTSLNLDARDTIRTRAIEIAGPTRVSFWTQARGPENNEKLRVQYFSTPAAAWKDLTYVVSDGVISDQFTFHQFDLPADAYGSAFVLRFQCWGTSLDSTDDWWIDDVKIEAIPCRADYDSDGFITGIDYDLFVQDFEAGNMNADFDNDGFLTGIDFDLYVQAYEAGC